MARNHKAIYIHFDQRKPGTKNSPKSIHRYSDIPYSLIILKGLSYTDFGIREGVVGTAPVTTLREPLFYFCRDTDEDLASLGRTYKD